MEFYSESLFIDSGAHTLYNVHVLKAGSRIGKHGRELESVPGRWTQGDYSFFTLKKGSPFRLYCDQYAYFIKCLRHTDMLFVNVDVIPRPDLTWQTQQYFEQEHGIVPVPVVHFATPLHYVERYLERGYSILGMGGLGQIKDKSEYYGWADSVFKILCPQTNNYRPIVRVHGFAMTSWDLMLRYPWWSVDSASWVKTAAYGAVLVPYWSDDSGWVYDEPPLTVAISKDSPSTAKGDHFLSLPKRVRDRVLRWFRYVEQLAEEDGMPTDVVNGCADNYAPRILVNLHYFKGLETYLSNRPKRLDPAVAHSATIAYRKGFGF